MTEMIAVDSSNLEAVGYDAENETLYVNLKNGARYAYAGVPQTIYDELMASSSKGKYFVNAIRNSFDYTKL